ncbi:hypothetical protein EDB84DRAFT_1508316 [Lactarius hengduanensis]|nr:hypothetical protein EDB84DRAFT_1508316 [Lactarius hengduanensis]
MTISHALSHALGAEQKSGADLFPALPRSHFFAHAHFSLLRSSPPLLQSLYCVGGSAGDAMMHYYAPSPIHPLVSPNRQRETQVSHRPKSNFSLEFGRYIEMLDVRPLSAITHHLSFPSNHGWQTNWHFASHSHMFAALTLFRVVPSILVRRLAC